MADTRNEQRPAFSIRDLIYLVALTLVLAVWGWDRGRLATTLEELNPPPSRVPTPLSLVTGRLTFLDPPLEIIWPEPVKTDDAAASETPL